MKTALSTYKNARKIMITELDMNKYSIVQISTDEATFHPRSDLSLPELFLPSKKYSWNELCERREARQEIQIPECRLETEALRTMKDLRSCNYQNHMHSDKIPKDLDQEVPVFKHRSLTP